MKNAVSFIFAVILGVVGLSACGGGGGSSAVSIETTTRTVIRQLTPAEQQELNARAAGRYDPVDYTRETISDPATQAEFQALFRQFQLTLSPNTLNGCVGANCDPNDPNMALRHVVSKLPAGTARVVETSRNSMLVFSTTMVIIAQTGTNYLAFVCEEAPSATDICSYDNGGAFISDSDVFTLPSMEYTITGPAVFKFADGLIGEDALNYRGLYFTEEHAEFRHVVNEYINFNSGYRRFPGTATDLMYTGVNFAYENWRVQYRIGDVRSDYYKDETIDGMAFGWQGEKFAAKAEKPFGGNDKAWFRLFYKTDL